MTLPRLTLRSLSLTLICSACLRGQSPLEFSGTVKLPSPSKGTFGSGFPFVGESAYIGARLRVLPDQSVLILLPNTSGNWVLEHVEAWWTQQPKINTLAFPGWSGANARKGKIVETSLLVTDDGRYAVTIGTISDGIHDLQHVPAPPAQPSQPLSPQADALITVVELHKFSVAKAIHLSTIAADRLYGAQIVGSNLLLESNLPIPNKPPYTHLYERIHRLLKLPDLSEGPRCTTNEIFEREIYGPNLEEKAETNLIANNKDCADVIRETNMQTALDLEFKTFLNQQAEPDPVLKDAVVAENYQPPRPLDMTTSEAGTILSFIGDRFERDTFRYLSGDESIFSWNPAFQSSDGQWFSLNPNGKGMAHQYVLNEYDRIGHVLRSQSVSKLMKPSTKDACGCKVADVSDVKHTLLAQCRNWKVDFGGADDTTKQWIGLIDTTTLNLEAESTISTDYAQRLALAVANDRAYVLVLTRGSTLSIYAAPQPNTSGETHPSP